MELSESNESLFESASNRFKDWCCDLTQMFTKSQYTGHKLDAETWSDLYISSLQGALLVKKLNRDTAAIKRLADSTSVCYLKPCNLLLEDKIRLLVPCLGK